MYCISSDKKPDFINSEMGANSITYGTLPLKLDEIELRGDTIEFHFFFHYDGKKLTHGVVNSVPYWGTVILKESSEVLMYASTSDFRYVMLYDPKYCEAKPLQKEVSEYIRKNKTKIHPWFLKEAKKKKVI